MTEISWLSLFLNFINRSIFICLDLRCELKLKNRSDILKRIILMFEFRNLYFSDWSILVRNFLRVLYVLNRLQMYSYLSGGASLSGLFEYILIQILITYWLNLRFESGRKWSKWDLGFSIPAFNNFGMQCETQFCKFYTFSVCKCLTFSINR